MLRIERLLKPLNDTYPAPVGYLDGDYATHEDAQDAIEGITAAYHHNGFDERQGYWWARNTGDIENNIFVIRGV